MKAKSRGKKRFRNTKRAGECSEAAFLHKASELGFGVAKPWGDSERYDFILDNGRRLLRVQVKATDCLRAQAYETRATYTVGKGRAVYSAKDIDFLVAHVVPLNTWYVLPVEACVPAPMLRFYPHRKAKQMRLEEYREAWELMREGAKLQKPHPPAKSAGRAGHTEPQLKIKGVGQQCPTHTGKINIPTLSLEKRERQAWGTPKLAKRERTS